MAFRKTILCRTSAANTTFLSHGITAMSHMQRSRPIRVTSDSNRRYLFLLEEKFAVRIGVAWYQNRDLCERYIPSQLGIRYPVGIQPWPSRASVPARAYRLGGVGQMDDNLEFRSFPVGQIQVRTGDAAPTQTVSDVAVFGQLSEDLGFFREKAPMSSWPGTAREFPRPSLAERTSPWRPRPPPNTRCHRAPSRIG